MGPFVSQHVYMDLQCTVTEPISKLDHEAHRNCGVTQKCVDLIYNIEPGAEEKEGKNTGRSHFAVEWAFWL